MGTALVIVSGLALLFWVMMAVAIFVAPSWLLGFDDPEDHTYFERLVGEDAPEPGTATDEELRNHFIKHFPAAQPDLPAGVTEETYANTMVYFMKARAGEDVRIPEFGNIEDGLDPEFAFLPGGLTPEATIRELMLKDRAFFDAHTGTYRLLLLVTAAFFSIVAIIILRMAMSWRQGDPFGRGTIQGLRWLGILFLIQFFASLLVSVMVPSSGFWELTVHSAMFDDLVTNSGTGATLSCGIVFLTLSWVLEYGRKMKEEQALTI